MNELKLCPHCGSKAYVVDNDWVACTNIKCHNRHGSGLSPREWNHRPCEDALEAEVARLRECVKGLRIMMLYATPNHRAWFDAHGNTWDAESLRLRALAGEEAKDARK